MIGRGGTSVFVYIRIREWMPLAAATALIMLCFLLPRGGGEDALPAVGMANTARPTLVIDAGHGGEDGGASTAGGALESEINLAVAQKLDALARLFGVDTVMTRTSEAIDYPPEAETTAARKRADQSARLRLINTTPGAVLVSIHQNFYPDPRPSGPQVFYADTPGSRELAETAHSYLVSALAPDSRRVAAPASEDIYLMREADCTAILAECGFLSNPQEAAALETEDHRTAIAAALLAAFLEYCSMEDVTVT